MKKYTKIDTIFERDLNGTKKLIEGKFRDKTVEFLKDNEWICTEKIDGMNIGIVWDGHAISYQGRTERAEIPTGLLNTLEECFGGSINEELFEQKFGEMPVILFGEGYGGKIQVKRGYKFKPKFILFDVYLPEKDLWMERPFPHYIDGWRSFHSRKKSCVQAGYCHRSSASIPSPPGPLRSTCRNLRHNERASYRNIQPMPAPLADG